MVKMASISKLHYLKIINIMLNCNYPNRTLTHEIQ